MLLGTPQVQQVARDISAQEQSAQQVLKDGRDNEIRLLRCLNENLQR